jgi:Zn-dependent alcohol dehydrogenase
MGTLLTSFGIRVQGALFGSCNPRFDIPNLLRLWEEGTLNLSDLISARYPLEDIRQGYRDQAAGRLIRGLIDHQAGSQTRLLQ